MSIAVIALTVLCVLLLFALMQQQARYQDQMSSTQAAHNAERRELISRVQRPDLIPAQEIHAASSEDLERRRMVQRELNSIGTVQPLEQD